MTELHTFQIVIPTIKGREKYLSDAINSVLKQNDSDISVIVSNNGADPAIKKCVEAFNSSRIEYFETEKQLAMAEHWELAISHVTADFFSIIGDDDALTPSCINYLKRALHKFPNTLSIVHKPAQYFWPDYVVNERRNLYIVHGGNSGEITEVPTKGVFNKVCQFREHYGSLPFLYHGFVSTSLVRKIQDQEGRIFARIAPDIYSDLLLAAYLSTFVVIDATLTVGGQGAKSNGANVLGGTEEGKVFFENIPDFLTPKRPARSVYLQLFEYIERIKGRESQHIRRDLNWTSFFSHSLVEAIKSDSSRRAIIQGIKDVLIEYCPVPKRVFFLLAIRISELRLARIILRRMLEFKELQNYKKWSNAKDDFAASSVLDVAWAINARSKLD